MFTSPVGDAGSGPIFTWSNPAYSPCAPQASTGAGAPHAYHTATILVIVTPGG